MFTKLLSTGGINVLATGCQLITIIVLGRHIPEEDFGKVHLVLASIAVLSTLTLAGQNNAATRFFAAHPPQQFNWHRYTGRFLLISLFLAGLCTTTLSFLPQYHLPALAVIGISGSTLCLTQFLAGGLLRATNRTNIAILLNQSWSIFAALGVILLKPHSAPGFYEILVISHGLGIALSLCTCWHLLPNGRERVPPAAWIPGIWFWLISVSMILSKHADRLLLGSLVPLEELGAYGAVVTLMAGFDVLMSTVGFILLPAFAKGAAPKTQQRTLEVAAISALAAVFYLGLGEKLLALFFQGRYDHVASLIPILTLAGVIKVAYALPVSLLSGTLETRALKRFAYGNLAFIALTIGGTWLLGSWAGLKGVAWATVGVWTCRFLFVAGLASTEPKRTFRLAEKSGEKKL